jgi:hypothetical protein
VEAVASGQRLPHCLGAADVERELQLVFAHWADDEWLSRSGLWRAGPLRELGLEGRSAARLRVLIGRALQQHLGEASAQQALALRAVQLGYLMPRVSHEAAAERLAVSRATFYRLLKRGTRGLAQRLVDVQAFTLRSMLPLAAMIECGGILQWCPGVS